MGFLLFDVFGYGDKQGFCAPLMTFIAVPRVLGSKQATAIVTRGALRPCLSKRCDQLIRARE
jgi:hypothetical protein